MVVMERIGEPLGQLARRMVVDVDQRRHAIALLVEASGSLPDAGSRQVADRLGTVLVAAGRDDPIKLGHQLVVDRDGHALHGACILGEGASRKACGACSLFSAAGQSCGCRLCEKSKPARTETVRAGRVDRRGVDGGARADRKPQELRGGQILYEEVTPKWCLHDPGRPGCGRTYLGRGTYPAGSKPTAIFLGLLKK